MTDQLPTLPPYLKPLDGFKHRLCMPNKIHWTYFNIGWYKVQIPWSSLATSYPTRSKGIKFMEDNLDGVYIASTNCFYLKSEEDAIALQFFMGQMG